MSRSILVVAAALLSATEAGLAMQGGTSPARLREVVVNAPEMTVPDSGACREVIRTVTRPGGGESREGVTYCQRRDGSWGPASGTATAGGIRSATPAELQDLLIVRGGETIAAERGMQLYAGTSLSTGDGTALLTFEGDAVEVQVYPNSQVDILNPSVRAAIGGLFVKIRERLREAFRVESEYGVAGAEGTQFAVFTAAGHNVVEVYQGRVSVTPNSTGGPALEIEPGQGVLLRPNAEPQVYPLPERRIRAVLGSVRVVAAAADIDYPPIPVADPPPTVPDADPALVREAQYLLDKLAYDPGPETGELDERTRRAIIRFKADTGQQGGPVVDAALLESLEAEWKRRTEDIRERLQPEGRTPGLDTPAEGKDYPPGHLTPAQIRRCAMDKISTDQQRQPLDDELRRLNEAVTALNAEAAELQVQFEALDQSDEGAVDAYNARVDAYRARVRAHEEGPARAYEMHEAEWQAVQDEINERCTGKPVWREDVDRVKQDLGLKRFPFTVVSGP